LPCSATTPPIGLIGLLLPLFGATLVAVGAVGVGRDGGDADARGVAREDGAGLRHLGDLLEDLELQGHVLGGSLHDEVGLGVGGEFAVGVALVGLAHPGLALHHRKALAFAFANAAIIAVYTFVDGMGVRAEVAAGGSAWRYVLVLFVLDGLPYPLLVWLRRTPGQRRAIVAYAGTRWPKAALGGCASIGSYAIALWAMTQAPVAIVAALRETSVLFAALLGTWLLKEKFGLQRAVGTAVVVLGVIALRLS
jgi:uncharacterized membrane protein